VVRDSAGNLYGTAFGGGTGSQGIVYKLDTSDQETVLYSFTGRADGGNPYGRVLLDSAGNLYGTANLGGKNDNGVIFKINRECLVTDAASAWNFNDTSSDTPGSLQGDAGALRRGGFAFLSTAIRYDPSRGSTLVAANDFQLPVGEAKCTSPIETDFYY